MAYEYEADEWRRATVQLTEAERAALGHPRAADLGMCGDRDDDARGEVGSQR